MVGINFSIAIAVRNLNEIPKITKEIQKFERVANKAFAGTGNQVKKVNAHIKVLNKTTHSLGSQLGFVAFQFTFMAGVAMHMLQQLKGSIEEVINAGAESQDALLRATLATGFDITDQTEDNIKGIKRFTDAIRTLGSGETIFNTQEVGKVFETVGRALPDLKTHAETVNATLAVSIETLKLMTVETVDAKDAAEGYAGILANYGDEIKDVGEITDTLVNVNRQSRAELNELVNSFGFASQEGKKLGLSIQEVGAMLGLVHNITPQAGRAFTQLMREMTSESTVFNTQLSKLGIDITDTSGNFRPFITVMKEVAMKTKEIRKEFGDKGVVAFESMFGLDSNAARAFLAIVNNADKLDTLVEGASKRGTADQLTRAIQSMSAKSRLAEMKASMNSLQTDFVIGLLPVLNEASKVFKDLAADKDLQEFFRDFGKALSDEVLPLLKEALKIFKFFIKVLKENKGLLKLTAQAVVALSAVLIGLFVIGTVGAMFALGAGTLAKLGAAIWAFISAATALRLSLIGVAISEFLAVGGIYILIAALAALAALGVADIISMPGRQQAGGGEEEELKTGWEALVEIFNRDLPNAIENANTAFNTWLNDSLTGFGDWIDSIDLPSVTEMFDTLKTGFEDLTGIDLDDVWTSITTFFDNLKNIDLSGIDFSSIFNIDFTKISEDITNFFNELPIIISEKLGGLGEVGRLIASYIWYGFIGFVNDSINFVSALLNNLTGGGLDQFFAKGAELGMQIWEGIKTAVHTIMELLFPSGGASEFLENITMEIQEFLADPKAKMEEWAGEIGTATEQTIGLQGATGLQTTATQNQTTSTNQHATALNTLTTWWNSIFTPASNLFKTSIDKNKAQLDVVHDAFVSLQRAADELAAKIRRTQVSYTRNPAGGINGFKLSGGVSKDDVANLASNVFASGGIVNKPTVGLIGEAGPEAVIPLSQLSSIMSGSGGNITISNNITIEGSVDEYNAGDLADQISDQIVDKIRGTSFMRKIRT